MAVEFHLAEDPLALHLLLQHLEGLIDIVVTDKNLHAAFLFDRPVTGPAVDGPVATVELHRPERRNAWTLVLGQELGEALAELDADDTVRAVVITGSGPTFSVGADLKAGDNVQVSVRARAGASLADIEATAAALVGDHGNNSAGHGRALFLYVGTVAGGQAGGHIALHVTGGNWRSLRSKLGQSLDETFTYDEGTIFLLWQGKVPTVIDPSQLKAGDRITVRVRAARAATRSR